MIEALGLTIHDSFIDKAEERVVLSMKAPGQHSLCEPSLFVPNGKRIEVRVVKKFIRFM